MPLTQLALFFLLVFALSFTATAADTSPDVAKAIALPAAVPGQRVAKIGLNEWIAIAEAKGWLAEEFAKTGARVEVVDIRAAGTASAEAALFKRGDLHIAQRMAYPALQHRANGFDLVVIWAGVDCNPRRATTIVPKKSKIEKLEDLKGKLLAGHRLGCPYFATFEALKIKGIEQDTELKKGDVRYINITGNAAITTFLAGEIDAMSTHPAMYTMAALYDRGLVREIGAAAPDGVYVSGGGRALVMALREFATHNPDLIQAYLRAYNRTRAWIIGGNHWDDAAQIVADRYRITKGVALYTIKDSSHIILDPGQTDYENQVDSLRRFLKWAITNGDDFYSSKPLSDQQLRDFVDRRFFVGGEFFVDTSDKAIGVTPVGLSSEPSKSAALFADIRTP